MENQYKIQKAEFVKNLNLKRRNNAINIFSLWSFIYIFSYQVFVKLFLEWKSFQSFYKKNPCGYHVSVFGIT